MKTYFSTLTMAFLITVANTVMAQKVEVLYFKANLACCKAKSCNALSSEINYMVTTKYTDGSVAFKEVKLADTLNNALIQKYNAKSQTVILVYKKKKKEKAVDVSDLVQQYLQDKNKEAFDAAFYAKVNALIK